MRNVRPVHLQFALFVCLRKQKNAFIKGRLVHSWLRTGRKHNFYGQIEVHEFLKYADPICALSLSRKHLLWWDRMGQTVTEWVSACVSVCGIRRLVQPTGSPAANQTGWTETGPPLPLSRVAYRTEAQHQTSPQSAMTSETSDGRSSGTERRYTNNESRAIRGHQLRNLAEKQKYRDLTSWQTHVSRYYKCWNINW